MRLKTVIKFVLEKSYKPTILRYLASDRKYRYKDIEIMVKSGVFHPGLFFSTKLFLKFIENLQLSGKSFLELGAGTGLISIFAVQRGAIVTASDISKTAIENLSHNATLNKATLKIIESDLFEQIPNQIFDIIVIAPPYYPQDPDNEREYAWYCGRNFEYFEGMFSQLQGYANQDSEVFMMLSEDCQIERIRQIAQRNRWDMKIIFQKRVLWEMNFIFTIKPIQN